MAKREILANNKLISIRKSANAMLNAMFILLSLCFVLPVVLVIIVSFTPERTITLHGYEFFPSRMSDFISRAKIAGEDEILLSGVDWEFRSAYLPADTDDTFQLTIEVTNDGAQTRGFVLSLVNAKGHTKQMFSHTIKSGETVSLHKMIPMQELLDFCLGASVYNGEKLDADRITQMMSALKLVTFGENIEVAGNVTLNRQRWFTLYNYEYLFRQPEIVFRAYGVTIMVTVIGTLLSVLIIALYAYPLSRRDYPYRKFLTVFMFITMVFTGGLVPYYIVVKNVLKIADTIWCMILPLVFNSFWCIVMRTFYHQSVPESLIESAKLDGATEMRTFFQIIVPISLPGLATIALFMFVTYWNDYFQAMLFLNQEKDSLQSMQYLCHRALNSAQFLRTQAANMGLLSAEQLRNIPDEGYRMAIAVVTMGPILVIYPFFQKYFIHGLTIGAVKG